MNQLLKALLAGSAVLALSGGAMAAEESARDTGRDAQNQTQGAPVEESGTDVNTQARDTARDADQGQAAGTVDQENKETTAEGRDPKKEDYQAELKKCDSMGASEKKLCVDAAKKKYGQM
jgi:hypothetical protein